MKVKGRRKRTEKRWLKRGFPRSQGVPAIQWVKYPDGKLTRVIHATPDDEILDLVNDLEVVVLIFTLSPCQ